MLVALEICHAQLDLLELESRLTFKQVTQGLQSIFVRLRFFSVDVLEHFGLIDKEGADLYHLLLHEIHVLEYTIVHDVYSKVIFNVHFLLLFIKLDVVDSTHQFE